MQRRTVERINNVFGNVCRRFKLKPEQLPGMPASELVRMVKAVDFDLNKKIHVGVDDEAVLATAKKYAAWVESKK